MANAMLDAQPMTQRRAVDPYLQGYQAARAECRQDFERTLAVLREENSTLRRMVESASTRADTLATELARSLVIQAPAPKPGPAVPPPVRRTSPDPIAGLGNLLDPVPLGHPEGEFDRVSAASLMAITDDDASGAETDGAARAA